MARPWLWEDRAYWTIDQMRVVTLAEGRAALRQPRQQVLRLIMPLSGAFSVTIEGERIPLFGSLMLLTDGSRPCGLSGIEGGVTLLLIDFAALRCQQAGDTLLELYHKYPEYRRFCQSDAAYTLFDDSYALLAATGRTLPVIAAYPREEQRTFLRLYASYMILVVTCEAYCARPAQTGSKPVRGAIAYLSAHCTVPVTARETAAALGMNTARLQRLFAAETGLTMQKYVHRLRMERVRFLLMHTGFSLEEIAHMTGLGTPQYLSRAFRAYAGMTPRVFRGQYNTTCVYGAKRSEGEEA